MRILLVDNVGTFTQDLAAHWRASGHEVLQTKEFNPYDVVGRDFVFVEWADENAIRASHRRLPVPLVVRLHRYEQFIDTPNKINWKNVDRLIYGSQHVADYCNANFLPACPNIVIPSAVDLDKWTFRKRHSNLQNPQVAIIGEIDPKKGIQLFLQVVSQWKNATFHLLGKVFDTTYLRLLTDYCKKANISDRVQWYGTIEHKDLDAFMEKADYLLSCSPDEGHPYAITEAMAKGVKPLIYNFSGAETLFPKDLLWLTLKDLKLVIDDTYDSEKYRQWLVDHGWTLDVQMKQFDEVLANSGGVTIDDVRKYYDNFIVVQEMDLERPNQRLQAIFAHIQKHITKDDSVLDLGCGIGITTNEISKYANRVFGIELSPKLVESARKNFPNLTFVDMDITEMLDDVGKPYPVFDINTACLFDCLEHIIPERRAVLYEKLKQFDKILLTIPFGQTASGKRLQIIDEEVPVDEITFALDTHAVSVSQTYDLAEWGQYRFLLLEKAKKEVPKELELAYA